MKSDLSPIVTLINVILPLTITFALILVGYLVGRHNERKHYRELAEREARLAGVAVPTNLKNPPGGTIVGSFLVIGSVVIASDYYKTIGANLKSLVGGRLTTLETLMERGRREAILRMREQAAGHGAQMVLNVRIESSTIASARGRASMPSVEVIAYGSAVVLGQPR